MLCLVCHMTYIVGILMSVALAIYPAGWKSQEVKYFCGEQAEEFNKSECKIGKITPTIYKYPCFTHLLGCC